MFPDPEDGSQLPKLEIFNPSDFSLPFSGELVPKLLHYIEIGEDVRFTNLEIVFTDEEKITEINSEFLNRVYVTDIISFRYDEDFSNNAIEGTLYCCAPRIEEQSRELNTNPAEEFLRIIAHGALHLTGYSDKTDAEKKQMTSLENIYLAKVMAGS